MPRVRAFSPTRLRVYQDCARRYYYQYVIKLPRKRAAAQSVGISLHGALEAVELAGGVGETGIAGALELLAARWEADGFASPEEEEAARREARTLLAAYLSRPAQPGSRAVMVEQKLEGSYAGVPLLGIVDRVDRLADGSLALIDYKSGQGGLTAGVQLQLAVYRYLVREQLGETPKQVLVHQLASQTSLALELTESGWTGLLEEAARTARAIDAEQDYAPVTGGHCAICDFKHRCLAYKAAGRSPLPVQPPERRSLHPSPQGEGL